jgi:hypothetical protein
LIVYAYPVKLAGAAIDQIVLTIGSLDPVVSGAAEHSRAAVQPVLTPPTDDVVRAEPT